MAIDGYRLSIDFGTSTTVAVLAGPDGRVRPLLFDSSPLLPSAVFADGSGALLTGADAERAAIGDPARLEPYPKRCVDDATVWLGREVAVEDLIGAVLGRVAAEARRVAGGPPADVVLSHPATWGTAKLNRLVAAADRAGLPPPRLVPEPVAAARHFAVRPEPEVPTGSHVVVYDLGAGTFDVSVLRRDPEGFTVVAADGLADVGGLDLDAVVVAHARSVGVPTDPAATPADPTADPTAAAAWRRLGDPRTDGDRHARHTLWRDARAAKEHLSRHERTHLPVPLTGALVEVTRVGFAAAAEPLIARTVTLTREVLRRAGVPPELVRGVYLVGGASRVPLVAKTVHRMLGIAPTVLDHPELVVAEGALTTDPVLPPVPTASVAASVATGDAGDAGAGVAAPAGVDTAWPAPVREPDADRDADPDVVPVWRRRRARIGALVAVAAVAAVVAVVAWHPWTGGGEPAGSTVRGAQAVGQPLIGHADWVRGLAFSPDGRTLASAGDDMTVRLWDVATRQPSGTNHTLTGHQHWVSAVAFSADGKTLAAGSYDLTVRLWDTATRQSLGQPLTGHTGWIADLAFSSDNTTVATAAWDGTVRLWDVPSQSPLGGPLTGHVGVVSAVAFSPDGKTLASAGQDRTVRLWDVATRQPLGGPMGGHTGWVWAIAWHPDGTTMATGSWDRTIRLWDVPNRKPLGDALTGHSRSVEAVTFDRDGDILVSASDDGILRVWDVARRRTIGDPLTGHRETAAAAVFSPAEDLFATSGEDQTIQLWRLTRTD